VAIGRGRGIDPHGVRLAWQRDGTSCPDVPCLSSPSVSARRPWLRRRPRSTGRCRQFAADLGGCRADVRLRGVCPYATMIIAGRHHDCDKLPPMAPQKVS
jgi:hypothetical protein